MLDFSSYLHFLNDTMNTLYIQYDFKMKYEETFFLYLIIIY